jgi:hypothetical protein
MLKPQLTIQSICLETFRVQRIQVERARKFQLDQLNYILFNTSEKKLEIYLKITFIKCFYLNWIAVYGKADAHIFTFGMKWAFPYYCWLILFLLSLLLFCFCIFRLILHLYFSFFPLSYFCLYQFYNVLFLIFSFL